MRLKKSKGMVLITLVFSLLIAAILAFFIITYYTGRKGEEAGPVTAPIDRAKIIQCQSQIRRIETTVQMYYAENVQYPSSLRELEGLSEADFYCPVTNNPYEYNSITGRVTCSGH